MSEPTKKQLKELVELRVTVRELRGEVEALQESLYKERELREYYQEYSNHVHELVRCVDSLCGDYSSYYKQVEVVLSSPELVKASEDLERNKENLERIHKTLDSSRSAAADLKRKVRS